MKWRVADQHSITRQSQLSKRSSTAVAPGRCLHAHTLPNDHGFEGVLVGNADVRNAEKMVASEALATDKSIFISSLMVRRAISLRV